jgi:hypothetical protein
LVSLFPINLILIVTRILPAFSNAKRVADEERKE